MPFRFYLFILTIALLCQSYTATALQAVVNKSFFYQQAANGSGLTPYLDLYWQIDPHSLLFYKEDSVFKCRIETLIEISDRNGIAATDHYVLETKPTASAAAALNQTIIELKRIPLIAGDYKITLTLHDLANPTADVFKDSIIIESPFNTPTLSGVQLIDTAVAASNIAPNPFLRNGQLQFPMCAAFMDENRKKIQYYAEAYTDAAFAGMIISKVFISRKAMETPINKLEHTDTLAESTIHPIAGSLSLRSLSSGNYYLNILLQDSMGKHLSQRSIFFQMINTHPEAIKITDADTGLGLPKFVDLSKIFVSKYTKPQVRAILKMLLPIASPQEKRNINEFIAKPDDMYSRYFIYNFWLQRNRLNPEEDWKKYTDRVKQANKLFGSSLLPGYETDRGIIYLKYGEPTDRIIVTNESGALPYEVWQYNVMEHQTNGIFLFASTGVIMNDYKLLHTTVNGELHNRRWRTTLYANGTGDALTNSRAEQLIGNR